ncbi:hypothetical protein BJX68DRAFT_231656 [Aspergillus pseudodeflectus]|uniref:C2H2-type domain-containing protein n=1 Tax=Aspergillus pseudodeflectus TaxID=176178 RepID=A0ABR4KS87_9EURO
MNPEESEHLVAELQLRKPQFQCGLCLQSFTRMDHLRRHVSSRKAISMLCLSQGFQITGPAQTTHGRT